MQYFDDFDRCFGSKELNLTDITTKQIVRQRINENIGRIIETIRVGIGSSITW